VCIARVFASLLVVKIWLKNTTTSLINKLDYSYEAY
jgi:hypothetical protein